MFLSGGVMTEYHYCEPFNERVPDVICNKRLSEGMCHKDKKGNCKKTRTVNISGDERTKRSERMKNLRKEKKDES
jgi:hypothetical protein